MNRDNYIHISKYSIDTLKKKVSDIPIETWNEWTHKQDTYDVHKDTLTIPLLVDETYGRTSSEKGIKSDYFKQFENELTKIQNKLIDFYGPGEIIRAEFALLKAGKCIAPHIDLGQSLTNNQRIHLPIISNLQNFFTVNKELKCLEVGNIYEIDNTGEHSVYNNSTVDRIHLIMDYKKKASAFL